MYSNFYTFIKTCLLEDNINKFIDYNDYFIHPFDQYYFDFNLKKDNEKVLNDKLNELDELDEYEEIIIRNKMDEISESYVNQLNETFQCSLCINDKMNEISDVFIQKEIHVSTREAMERALQTCDVKTVEYLNKYLLDVEREFWIKKARSLRRTEAHNNLEKWKKYSTILELLKSR